MNTRSTRSLIAAATVALLTSACSVGSAGTGDMDVADRDPQTETPSTSTTVTPVATTDPPATDSPQTPGGLDLVAAATVQIIAQGSFVDPEFGAYEGAGSGTGFIIDASGLAVTNNHVVVGAGLLQVFVPGEDEPRNATVLGVSECSDLAVIDIDGDSLPTLGWYSGDVNPGLEVYAAGYPLSDPEYTLTRGIVSKADAGGESGWASVDHVIEHDAAIQPGNSGGPLVTADGEVVAINYATWTRTNTDQFLAIESSDALEIIAELRAGRDVDSLGINGQAVANEDGSLTGVWVSGVASGSPADVAGVEPGDIVTRLEGVSLATDGTMADYCDVMRTHQPTDTLSLEVVRFATSELLSGQINGEPLELAFSFAEELADDAPDATAYENYVTVTDDSGTLSMSVPAGWSQVDGAPIDIDGTSSPSIMASPDLAAYTSGWETPGVQFVASAALAGFTADELLDLAGMTDCTSEGRQDYDDGAYVGRFETFAGCAGTSTSTIAVAAFPADGDFGVLVVVQVVSEADLAALDEILRTFTATD